jgi:antitoxin component YwqK of YwqJK toxin-antitoxin module
MTAHCLPLVALLILGIGVRGGCAPGARTSATGTTQPATQPAADIHGLCIKYVWGGGIRGDFHTVLIATPDVAVENGAEEPLRVSGEKAQAIVKVLRREGVMNWPEGIHGRGEWHDNYHYFLDLTMDGATHAIHVADGPTADEAQRLQALMKKIQEMAHDATTQPLHVEEIRAEKGNVYPEGTLIETKTYYLNASGEKVLHGPDIHFYEDGKTWRQVEYRDGKMDGLLVEYDPYFGEKAREVHYRDDRREGPAVEWYSKGRKASECTYHHDRIVGKRLYWNETNGALRAEEVYDDDGYLAEFTVWHENGQKAKHGQFKGVWPDVWGGPQLAGKRDGTWTYWDDQGKVVAEGQWRKGEPWEGTCIVPRSSGSLFVGEKGTYHGGKLVGPVTKQLDF